VRHAVVIVSIGKTVFNLAMPTIEAYCRRYGLALEVISEPRFRVCLEGSNYQAEIFEKFRAGEMLAKYDRILRLDCDVLVSCKCPNIFDVVPETHVGVVFEDVGGRAAQRREQMECVARSFELAPWGSRRYFNSGVVVASQCHREMFMLAEDDLHAIRTRDLAGCKEQNLLNLRVRESGFPVYGLDFRYNHLSMFSERWNRRARRRDSFILHYAGSQRRKAARMKRDRGRILAEWEGRRRGLSGLFARLTAPRDA